MISYAGWLRSSCLCLPAPALRFRVSMLFTWVLVVRLRSLCSQGKHLTDRAISRSLPLVLISIFLASGAPVCLVLCCSIQLEINSDRCYMSPLTQVSCLRAFVSTDLLGLEGPHASLKHSSQNTSPSPQRISYQSRSFRTDKHTCTRVRARTCTFN